MHLTKFKTFLFASLLTVTGVSALASCGNKESGGPTFVDYAHTQCQLALDYKGVDFFKKGVGEVTLFTTIDGDTAHFKPVVTTTSNLTIKARFYGIDTPESTGRVQPYGKQASNFTKEKLKNAAENGTIVLAGVSSAYDVPTTDANGRHLCCVWINEEVKHADYKTLVNLNLWIQQEGLCDPGSLDKMPDYADTFQAAYEQAKRFKLKLFSGLPDPLYNYGEYEDAYIPDICRAVQAQIKDPTLDNPYDGAKVRIIGTVVGFSNNTLFVQQADIVENDQGVREIVGYYSINIFCGMTQFPSKYRTPNTVIKLCGIAQDSEEFGFQLTGVEGHFPTLESKATENDCQILVKPSANEDPETKLNTFEYTTTELDQICRNQDFTCLNSGVALTGNLTVSKFKPNQENKKFTISFKEVKFELYITTAPTPDPDRPNDPWDTEEEWLNKVINIKEAIYTYHQYGTGAEKTTYYQLIVPVLTNIVWVH